MAPSKSLFCNCMDKAKGLTVSRFNRYDHAEIATTLGKKKENWKVVAKVLWLVGRAP
jgi:hypothetical protein